MRFFFLLSFLVAFAVAVSDCYILVHNSAFFRTGKKENMGLYGTLAATIRMVTLEVSTALEKTVEDTAIETRIVIVSCGLRLMEFVI